MKRGQGWSNHLRGDSVQGLHPLTHPTLLSQPGPALPMPTSKEEGTWLHKYSVNYSSEDRREPAVGRGREKQGRLSGQAWSEKPSGGLEIHRGVYCGPALWVPFGF